MTAVQHTTTEKKKAILIYIYTFGKYSIQSDLYHIQCNSLTFSFEDWSNAMNKQS